MKVVQGVWGNNIAAEHRKSKLPAKISQEAAFWFLTFLLFMSIGVCGFAAGISMLGI